MEDFIRKYLFDPTIGKIITVIIGVAVIWIFIKVIQRSLFSKIKDHDNHYHTKKLSSFIRYFLTIQLVEPLALNIKINK
jgi:hypothetical protein